MAMRDECSDVDRGKRPYERGDVMYHYDVSPTTLAEEWDNGGWTRRNTPIGVDPNSMPPIVTSGSAGAVHDADIASRISGQGNNGDTSGSET